MNEFEKYYGSDPTFMDQEVWRPVVENSRYEVSNWGKIRNAKTWRQMNPFPNAQGYIRVALVYEDHRTITYAIHRLICHAFYGELGDLQVNHIDGNKQNNRLDNLELCTASENMKHAFSMGLEVVDEENMHKKLESRRRYYGAVKCLETGVVYPDATIAGYDMGLDKSSIRKVTRGEREDYCGYHFEIADYDEVNFGE